jgi:hypothetical protein
MESHIQFQGPGPFDLPVAQRAKVEAGTDAATVSFRVLVNPNQPLLVRIAVPNGLLLELAAEIARAAPSPEEPQG